MEMILTSAFWSGLAAIVIINLVLSGDNAIVIAFAARRLPKHLQRRAIIWGTFGAVAVRVTLTGAVLWLLTIPGLSFGGGLLLACVAYQLLTGDPNGGGKGIAPASSFWGAMRTIIVADAAMGLDNVLGVAGAADGKLPLVVLGLGISIPIVAWGSTLMLKSIERFPALLYVGGAVLAWTAAKMLTEEPFVQELLDGRAIAILAIYIAIGGGTLGLAWLRNRRAAVRSRTEVLQ